MDILKENNIELLDNEIFKKVVILDGTVDKYYFSDDYLVSNKGRIVSLNYRHTKKPAIMKLSKFKNKDYIRVNFQKNGVVNTYRVHRLVMMAFDEEGYFDGAVIDHIDGNPANNTLENLVWCTQKYNCNNPIFKSKQSSSKKGMFKPKGKDSTNYKGYICIYKDGSVSDEMTSYELAELLGCSYAVVIRLAKLKTPYKLHNSVTKNRKHLLTLEGIRILTVNDYQELKAGA